MREPTRDNQGGPDEIIRRGKFHPAHMHEMREEILLKGICENRDRLARTRMSIVEFSTATSFHLFDSWKDELEEKISRGIASDCYLVFAGDENQSQIGSAATPSATWDVGLGTCSAYVYFPTAEVEGGIRQLPDDVDPHGPDRSQRAVQRERERAGQVQHQQDERVRGHGKGLPHALLPDAH